MCCKEILTKQFGLLEPSYYCSQVFLLYIKIAFYIINTFVQNYLSNDEVNVYICICFDVFYDFISHCSSEILR